MLLWRRGEAEFQTASPLYAHTAPFGSAGATGGARMVQMPDRFFSLRTYCALWARCAVGCLGCSFFATRQRTNQENVPRGVPLDPRTFASPTRRCSKVLPNKVSPSWAHKRAPKMGAAQNWYLYFSWWTSSVVRGLLFRGADLDNGGVFAYIRQDAKIYNKRRLLSIR